MGLVSALRLYKICTSLVVMNSFKRVQSFDDTGHVGRNRSFSSEHQ